MLIRNNIKLVVYVGLISLSVYSCDRSKLDEREVKGKTEVSDNSNEDQNNGNQKFNLRNPVLNQLGANLPQMIRAYFLVGEYEKMLQFVVVPECYDKETIIQLLRKTVWGYDIKLNNCKWNQDSSFVLSIKKTTNNTIGHEDYYGVIVNDTAKLVLFPFRDNLFQYYYDDKIDDPCILQEALENIYFEFDKSIILPNSKKSLNQILNYLKKHSDMNAEFVGHTSSEGSDDHNLMLSSSRAKAICDYMIKNGIKANRLNHVGMGACCPILPNSNEMNREKNRRVEILLSK